MKNYLAAIINYTSAINIDSNYANAYYNRGLASNALGNKQEAMQDYRKAADLYKQQGKDSRYNETLKEIQKLEINSIFLNKN